MGQTVRPTMPFNHLPGATPDQKRQESTSFPWRPGRTRSFADIDTIYENWREEVPSERIVMFLLKVTT
jgi:hypothetical protein